MFDAVSGVEPQSETVWRQADKYRVPRICFVNKMDRVGADFKETLSQIETKLQGNPVAIQLPIGAEDKFRGVVDLVRMKALVYKDETMGADYEVEDIPADMVADAQVYREKLIEKVSESNDKLLEKYLNGETITDDELKAALRQRAIESVRKEELAVRAGDLRIGVQEQGRAADARRGRRLPALAAGHSAGQRHRHLEEGRDRLSSGAPTTRNRSRRWPSRS